MVYFVFVDVMARFFFQGMNAAMLHIGPRSRNDYLFLPMEKLAKEGRLKKIVR